MPGNPLKPLKMIKTFWIILHSATQAVDQKILTAMRVAWLVEHNRKVAQLMQPSGQPILLDCNGMLRFNPACNNTGASRFLLGSSIQ